MYFDMASMCILICIVNMCRLLVEALKLRHFKSDSQTGFKQTRVCTYDVDPYFHRRF